MKQNKLQRITITIDQETLEKFNQLSDNIKLSRSAIIRTLINDIYFKLTDRQSISLIFYSHEG
ncbi:CopG family transcriptional regulator [Microvirga sp. 2MCAF35]|uniref:ribbon-helix-helix domain-containing protein n=1 Tax=Microvirga sp. 2MCAF35 TaxID=3232987 RepID=UPI003F958556